MWEMAVKDIDTDSDEEDNPPRGKLTRHVFSRPNLGVSAWAEMLRCADLHHRHSMEAKIFRKRIRVPHAFFLQLVTVVKESQGARDLCARRCQGDGASRSRQGKERVTTFIVRCFVRCCLSGHSCSCSLRLAVRVLTWLCSFHLPGMLQQWMEMDT